MENRNVDGNKILYYFFLTMTPALNFIFLILINKGIRYSALYFNYSILFKNILPALLIIINTFISGLLLVKSKNYNELNSFKIISLIYSIIFFILFIFSFTYFFLSTENILLSIMSKFNIIIFSNKGVFSLLPFYMSFYFILFNSKEFMK